MASISFIFINICHLYQFLHINYISPQYHQFNNLGIMNPENQLQTLKHNESFDTQIRCRICYMELRPLVTLCQCAGSIAYVHEECILDWISLKMTKQNQLIVPSCQICRTPYSARLRVGGRKLCFSTLRMKLCMQRALDKWLTLYFLIGAIFCLYLISRVALQAIWVIVQLFLDKIGEFTQSLREKPVEILFTHIILTSFFLREAFAFLAKLRTLVQQSYIQVIQFSIQPKMILR